MPVGDVLDMAHSLVPDIDPDRAHEMEAAFEAAGREWRQTMDPAYRRKTWGMTGGDAAAMIRLIKGDD